MKTRLKQNSYKYLIFKWTKSGYFTASVFIYFIIFKQFIMKVFFVLTAFSTVSLFSFRLAAQPNKPAAEHLYIDIHHMGAGKVTADAVAEAHAKELAVER